MNIHPSQWPRWQMMNAVMFWCAVWGIPAFGIAFYNYLFNGEAVLKAIPEGYEPREEEYERHPITRWYITSGISESEQQRLEENMYINWENVNNAQRAQLIMEVSIENVPDVVFELCNFQCSLLFQVKRVMSQDGDYAGFDWTPFSAHRVRLMNKNREELFTVAGHDNMN